MVDMSAINEAITATKTVVDLISSLRTALKRDRSADTSALEAQLEKAETALRLSHAKAAKSLGYT
ncbi:MAG: hypothetical protein ACLFWF_08400, partial [Alphaproteobacteria bacterium]